MNVYHSGNARIILALLISLSIVGFLSAQETSERQSEAYRSSVAQDTVRKDTTAIQAEITALYAELQRLSPEDAKALEQVLKSLTEINRNEMNSAVESLRGASHSAEQAAQLEKLSEAFKDQGAISTKLKRASVAIGARQSLAQTLPQLLSLLQRQVSITDEVARLDGAKTDPSRMKGGSLKQRYDSVIYDQNALAEEIGVYLKKLTQLAENISPESAQALLKATAIARDQKPAEFADAAAKSIQGVPYRSAPFATVMDSQRHVQAALAQMIGAFANSSQLRLQRYTQVLTEMISTQGAIGTQAQEIPEKKSIPAQLPQRQRDLSDRAAALREEIPDVSGRAAEGLDRARDAMEKLLIALEKNEKPSIPSLQQTAITELTNIKDEIEKQIALTPPKTQQELASGLTQLANEVAQAAQEQNRIATAPPNSASTPTQKEALRNKVQELQERALPLSPEASKALGDAANKMKQNDSASQLEATKDLVKISQDLSRQVAALNGQLPEQQTLAKAEDQIKKIEQNIQATEANLASGKTAPADAVNQMSAIQKELNAQQQQLDGSPNASKDAKDAVKKANQELESAKMNAAQLKTDAAKAAAERARDALGKANQALTKDRQAMSQKAAQQLNSKAQSNQNQQNDNSPQDVASFSTAGNGSNDLLSGHGPTTDTPAQVVTGLNSRDRDAISVLQAEKPPREFESQVQQYYKNLANGTGL